MKIINFLRKLFKLQCRYCRHYYMPSRAGGRRNVDKDELMKALQYDRGQYDKGYADGYKEAIREFVGKLKTEIAGLEVKSPSITYKCGMEYALYYLMPKIIDRLLEEMMEGNNGNNS